MWLASAASKDGDTAGYYVDRKEKRCPFRDEEKIEKLWALCARLTGEERE